MSLRKPFMTSKLPSSQASDGAIEQGSQFELPLTASDQGVAGSHADQSSTSSTVVSPPFTSQDVMKSTQYQPLDFPSMGVSRKKLNTSGLTKRKAGHQQQQHTLNSSSGHASNSGMEIAKARRSFEGVQRPLLATPPARKLTRMPSRGSFTSLPDQFPSSFHHAKNINSKAFHQPSNSHNGIFEPQSHQNAQDVTHTLTSTDNDEANTKFSSNYHLDVTHSSPFRNENDEYINAIERTREKSVGSLSMYDVEEGSLNDSGSDHVHPRPSKRRKSYSVQLRHLNEEDTETPRHGTPRLPLSNETFYAMFGRQIDEYAEANVEKYEKAMQRWSECTMEEWMDGAEGLKNRFCNILDRVKENMTSKLDLYDSLKKKLKDHQNVLSAREQELELAKNQLVREGKLFQGEGEDK